MCTEYAQDPQSPIILVRRHGSGFKRKCARKAFRKRNIISIQDLRAELTNLEAYTRVCTFDNSRAL